MKKLRLCYFVVFLTLMPFVTTAQTDKNSWYLGIGGDYTLPMGKFSNVNLPHYGLDLTLEDRQFCQLWYGFKVNYFNFNKQANIPDSIYYTSMFMLSPEVRWNMLLGRASNFGHYERNLIFYFDGQLIFSGIKGTDNNSLLGLGWALGLGITSPAIPVLSSCLMLDLNCSYLSPNAFLRDSKRNNLQLIDVSLNLSVQL